MRVSFFYSILIIFGLQAAFASEGLSQDIHNTTISIELNNEPLTVLFDKIERESKFLFAYNKQQVGQVGNITLDKKSRTVKELLDLAFANTTLRYRQSNRSIVVWEESSGESNDLQQSFVAPVSGIVKDKDGNPVPGASVVVKGTTRGTTTDSEGRYTIEVAEGETLVISFIGNKSVEVVISNQTVVDVTLEEDTALLQEVQINAGYYTVTREQGTGNIARITSDEISKQPVSNPLQSMIGRMPGVYIQQASGVPGGPVNVQIRGINSLRTEGNNALYIVDGVPFPPGAIGTTAGDFIIAGGNALGNINPGDIESIEVLKDADATAIYGSRGANGVVLITTKKGKAGEMNVNLDFYQGFIKVSQKMDLLNTKQYLTMRKEAFLNDEATPQPWDHDLVSWDTTRYTDWQDKLIGGTASVTSAQATVSGGSSNTQFLISTRYYRETSVFPGDFSDQKYSARFSINHQPKDKKFAIQFSGSYLVDHNQLFRSDLTATALSLAPVAPALYDDAGNLNWENNTWENPLARLESKFDSRTGTLVSNAVLSYELVKNLFIKANLGYTEVGVNEYVINPITSYPPSWGIKSGNATSGNNTIRTGLAEPQLSYMLRLGPGTLSAILGFTFQQTKTTTLVLRGENFGADALLENLQAAGTLTAVLNSEILYRYAAAFGRINYDIKGKYFVNFTGRRDGSSRFGPNKHFANVGAIGGAWIFSKESFMESLGSVISYGKLRASYGATGSDQIKDYGYYDLWNTYGFAYDGIKGTLPENPFNPDYGWEKNVKAEVGIELGFLNDRIDLGVSYYRNTSSNQLVGYPLPTTTGFSIVQANLPAEIRNTGTELMITSRNISRSDFSWMTALNFTIPRNELVSYPGLEQSPYRNTYVIGEPLSVVKRLHYTGVDPVSGVYTFADTDESGSISVPEDFQYRKALGQKFYGGISNSFAYKGLQLDIFFQFVKQAALNYLSGFKTVPGMAGNQPTYVLDRWQSSGDQTNVQKFTQTYADGYTSHSLAVSYGDNAVSDASFIRLKNVSLSYTFPVGISQKIKSSQVRIYSQCQNLLTWTRYKGLDPETQSFTSLPSLRTITFGAQLTF